MSSTLIGTQTAVEWWTVDPTRTKVEFEVEHFWGLHTVRGRFRRFDGVYFLGPAGPEIELTIDAGSVDTGNSARDRHLRSADFFDVDEHPQVRFTSTQVDRARERPGTGERRAGRGRHERSSRVRRIGADDRRRARARGDDDGRPARASA